jgi:hypothetical protein
MVTASIANLSTQPNWDYVEATTLTPSPISNYLANPGLGYMADYNVILDVPTVIIGVGCPTAKRTWKFGGYAYQKLLFTPSINSSFGSLVVSYKKYLKLWEQNLIEFPDFQWDYQLTIEFPQWLREIDLEIWKYVG